MQPWAMSRRRKLLAVAVMYRSPKAILVLCQQSKIPTCDSEILHFPELGFMY